MRWRVLIGLLLSSTLGVVVWCWVSSPWSSRGRVALAQLAAGAPGAGSVAAIVSQAPPDLNGVKPGSSVRRGHRLTNSGKSLDELMRNPRAILLENALLDTGVALDLPLPPALRSQGDPGSYIVQSRGELNASFRLVLARAGATLVAYIPNNAYLVRVAGAVAARLASDPQVGAVVPYEPYYKIKASLLNEVLAEEPRYQPDPGGAVPRGDSATAGTTELAAETPPVSGEPRSSARVTQAERMAVNVLLFAESQQSTLARFSEVGIEVVAQTRSPFGTIAEIRCPSGRLAWIARLPGVQELERCHPRVPANDLSRARIGVAADAVTSIDYLGLTGSNVLVNINDLGVDTNHPDLVGRVYYDLASSGVDNNGHGTHVAGIIAGSGAESLTITNAPGSVMPPVASQFRGLAPAAEIFSITVEAESKTFASDAYLQQTAAKAKALISNNSWHYADDTDYDLGAASYDAAVRDALPGVPGSQPLLCVFAAGNTGRGAEDGTGGIPDSVESPGTAKNVITVGALEQPRLITNQTWSCSTNGTIVTCQTNTPWLPLTDSSNQVASFSSRGNVGLGIEGLSGRFKPDVVAPGTLIISTRSTSWDQTAYYSSSNDLLNLGSNANSSLVLSNLNEGLGPFYRFESGTSLGAAEVSGTLALMQEFFQQRLLRTNSPALMKALLINGSRSVGSGYYLHSPGATNAQGWGLLQLPNSLPGVLTNTAAPSSSLWFFDQSPAEALATGQQRTRFVSVTPAAQSLPLRVTITWTDPPGNPVAGLKLVNDLDLILTNLNTGEVFWGNDIPAGTRFNSAWQPGTPPNVDLVNNVENVFLPPALGSNYSVTVLGRRVGVNAVNEHPNGVAQDYALVISSGNGQLTNALALTDPPTVSRPTAVVTPMTNGFAAGAADFGEYLLHQRVGANGPLLGTNTITLGSLTNTTMTIGTLSQWHFYVFTNDTSFTNAVFLTFLADSLSLLPAQVVPAVGSTSGQVWLASADLDLYVSRDSGLTNLDPAVLAAADFSRGRGGNETIIYSNAAPGVYYAGVKCESSQGADYGFLADVSQESFTQADSLGNEILRGFPSPDAIPRGSIAQPGEAYSFYVTPDSFPVRRVIVTNVLGYSSFSDLQATLNHSASSVILNNHSTNEASMAQTFVYDDSGEGNLPGAVPSDGPGSLRDFAGQDGLGQWLMRLVTTNQPGVNQRSWLFLERQQDLGGVELASLLPGTCREDFVSVPRQTTNLTATVAIASGTGPISLQVYASGAYGSNCATALVNGASANGMMTVDQTSQPPLSPGTYIVRTCNLGPDAVSLTIQTSTVLGLSSPLPAMITSTTPLNIPDNALCSASLLVTNTGRILAAEVGVRIDHPRISDLTLSLVSPGGARLLLAANRGGDSTNGLGANLVVTNTTPVAFSGGPEAVTNTFETGETSGTILINYNFFALPDDLRVYYENNLLFDSGLVSFGGSTNINYGPGSSTSFTIVMNQGGNTESNTAWFYSVTSTRIEPLFLTFTENTNLSITPIKFAPTPFTNLTVAPAGGVSTSGIFYLPEESLNSLVGQAAFGQWRLEIWDNRAGATNPPPTLLGWQLALWLADSLPTPISLSPGVPSTTLLGPGQIQWYEVDVPAWASFASNSLLSSTAPVNLLFNSSAPPTGTNVGDLTLALGATAGKWLLRTNTAPGIIPAARYYLGLENTNAATVTTAFTVNFDVGGVITLAAGVPYPGTNSGPLNSADFYRYVVSTNVERVQFEVNGPTSDVALVARKGLPLPNLGSFDFISSNPGTNDDLIVLYDYSRPVSLSSGEWFLAVVNVTGSLASYSILATEFTDYGTNLVLSNTSVTSNALCVTWSSLPGIHYYLEGKPDIADSDWTILSPTLTASDFTTTFCLLLPSPFEYFRVSEGLVLVPAPPIIASVGVASGGTLLQWTARTNLFFNVQWTAALAPANWSAFPGLVGSTNGTFLFFDNGSQASGSGGERFYRLRQMP